MASEVRVNQIQSRSGLGTITVADTGAVISGITTIDQGTTDGNLLDLKNEEVRLYTGVWGTGSTYPREVTLNGTRFDSGALPALRIAGQGGIKFAVDLNTVRMEIDSSGRVTKPYQPLAVAGKTTGSSSGTIVFEKVWHNVGSHYDNSTGVFTCPIAGYYYTHIMVMSNASDTTMDIGLQVNGSGTHQLVPYQAGTGGPYNQVSGSTIIYCSANDNLRYVINGGSVYGGGSSAGRHSSVIFHLVG